MTLAFLDAADSHKVYRSFASPFIHHTVVTSSDVLIQNKVLHLCNRHSQFDQFNCWPVMLTIPVKTTVNTNNILCQ